jgi:uncharacterized repeat protein (TIGR01451 family)
MQSRGLVYTLGAGARKSLVLLWTAVLLCSLLLQYAVIAAPTALAALPGGFELDGNTVSNGGTDWNGVYNDPTTFFSTDPVSSTSDDILKGGGSKDNADISSWLWTGQQPQSKDDIVNAYAYPVRANGDTIAFFGQDRAVSNGDAVVGFWFFKDDVHKTNTASNGGFTFSGVHKVGDIFVLADYSNGGATGNIAVYKWVGSGGDTEGVLDCVTDSYANTSCPSAANEAEADINRDGAIDAAWRAGIPQNAFFEGGVNLTELGLDSGCFSSFMAESRSSTSFDSTASDIVLGQFSFCTKPQIVTHVQQGGQNISVINKGESVVDTADLSGDNGTVTGSVEFFSCFDANSKPDCSTGGTSRGTKTLSGGSATSDSFTPTNVGYYCFRVEYAPAAGSRYLASSHTNTTTECVRVLPAEIDLTKTADDTSVAAGAPIGFTLSITSKGPGAAFGVKVSDTLPTNAGLDWSIDAAGTTGSWDLTGGVLSFGGASGLNMAQGAEYHVHIVSPTTPATCGTVDNTGDATTTNDGTDSASASITVHCPDVKVTKTPDGGTINAGEVATFSIKVENIGTGSAKNVTLSDNLPGTALVHWTESEDDCSISGADGAQILSCTVGDLAPGASKTYTVSADLTGVSFCGKLDNSATAVADNEAAGDTANNTDTGDITVLCASIDIEKVADAPSVSAGDVIGFTITVTSGGPGTAKGVQVSDTLPTDAGTSWSIDGGTAQAQCGILAGVLSCTLGDLASGQVRTVHITSPTTKATVADSPVVNTAVVTTTNDGTDTDTDQVVVLGASIDIQKIADAASVSAGDPIGFTITVTSGGPGDAKDVHVSDPLPTDAGTSWSIDGGTGAGQCQILAGSLTCDFGTLAKDATRTIHISSPTTKATVADSPVINTAHVTTSNDGSDDDTDQVAVKGPDIVVEKNADNSPISAGDKAGFTITVSNAGDGVARDVTLTDTLPGGIAWTTQAAGCVITSGVLTCSFGDLEPGASVDVKVSGETDVADCGTIRNTASAGSANEPDDRLDNNVDSASIIVNCPAVAITKTPVDPEVNATDQIAFDIAVTNTGDGDAFNVTVNDPLPTDAGLSWTIDAAHSDAGWSIQGGALQYGPATLAAKASVTVRIVSPTTPATCPSVHNEAFLTYTGGTGHDTGDIAVDCPDVVITKTADNSPILAGQTASFTISAWNQGEGTAYDVVISDELPAGVDWQVSDTEACSISEGVLTCQVGDLAPDAEPFTVTLSGATDAESCADIPNQATVSASNEPQGATGNNTDGDTVVVQCASITLVKTAGDAADGATLTIPVPGTVTFTYVVTNTGTSDVEDIQLVDDNATPANAADDITVICPSTTLAAGESMTCTADIPVKGTGITRTNIATVSAVPVLDSESTVSATDDAVVKVPAPIVTPRITPPPTSTIDEGTQSSGGNGLLLILLGTAGLMLVLGYVMPTPAKARSRQRSRRG